GQLVTSMTVNVSGVGDVVFTSTGGQFLVGTNTIKIFGGETLSVAVPSVVLAFGSGLAPANGPPLLTLTVTGDTAYSDGPSPLFSSTYFGARTATSFSTISYGVTNANVVLSDFEIGTAGSSTSSAPEVRTLILIGAGLLSFAALKRRRRRTLQTSPAAA